MRVLMVVHDFLPRHRAGTEIYAAALGEALATGAGVEVRFIVTESRPGARPGRVQRRAWRELEVVEVEHDHRRDRLVTTYRSPEALAAFEAELETFRPDLVHVQHTLNFGWEIVAAARRAGARVVMTLHDFHAVCPRGARMHRRDGRRCERGTPEDCAGCVLETFPRVTAPPRAPGWRRLLARLPEPLKARLRRWKPAPAAESTSTDSRSESGGEEAVPVRLEEAKTELAVRRALVGEALALVDHLIAPSAFLGTRCVASGLRAAERIEVSANGQEDRGLEPNAARKDDDVLRVGYVGTVSETKGVHVLAAAARRLLAADERKGEAPPIRFRIHGALDVDPGYAEALVARTADLPETAWVWAGGFTPDALAPILADLDVLVVPSLWWENAPLTIQEAFLAGVIPVVSDIGGMAEAVRHEIDGLHFRVGSDEDLAAAIERLRHAPAERRRLRGAAPAVKTIEADAIAMYERYRRVLEAPPRDPSPVEQPKISVVIPTLNGGELFQDVLDRVLAQDYPAGFEVIVIDSGSVDGTLARVRRRPVVRLIEIPSAEFDHGRTRQRGVEVARGEYVCFLTQDAVPADRHLLARLGRHLDADEAVAGAYAHQEPRPDCNPFQLERLRGWTDRREREERRLEGDWDGLSPAERYALCAYDHVAALSRRRDLLAHPLRSRAFGEDLAWGRDVIRAGRSLVLDPEARVVHSHERSIWSEARRVRSDHRELGRLFGLRAIPSLPYALAAGLKSTFIHARAAWRHPVGLGERLGWILRAPFFAFSQNLAQYLGGRAGRPES